MVGTSLDAVIRKCQATLADIEIRLCWLEHNEGPQDEGVLLRVQWAEVAEFVQAMQAGVAG